MRAYPQNNVPRWLVERDSGDPTGDRLCRSGDADALEPTAESSERNRGDEVTALVRSPSKAAALGSLGVRVVPGDLDEPGSLARAVEGQDVVFHVAGLLAASDENAFLRCNRDGTASLVQVEVDTPARGTGSRPGHQGFAGAN